MRAHDDSVDTERTIPGYTEREMVQRGLTDVLDGLTALLEEEIEYRRSKSDPPDGDRATMPSEMH